MGVRAVLKTLPLVKRGLPLSCDQSGDVLCERPLEQLVQTVSEEAIHTLHKHLDASQTLTIGLGRSVRHFLHSCFCSPNQIVLGVMLFCATACLSLSSLGRLGFVALCLALSMYLSSVFIPAEMLAISNRKHRKSRKSTSRRHWKTDAVELQSSSCSPSQAASVDQPTQKNEHFLLIKEWWRRHVITVLPPGGCWVLPMAILVGSLLWMIASPPMRLWLVIWICLYGHTSMVVGVPWLHQSFRLAKSAARMVRRIPRLWHSSTQKLWRLFPSRTDDPYRNIPAPFYYPEPTMWW